jgi:hypothetical protein
MRHYLDNYKIWSEENMLETPISQLMDALAKETSSVTGLPQEDIRKEVAHFSGSSNSTRMAVKYAMGTLHASAAP